jgi:hypothetical protein
LFAGSVSLVNPRSDDNGAWNRLLKNINQNSEELSKNKKLLVALPNTHMGSVARQGEIKKHLYHRDAIDDAFNVLKQLDWDATSLLPNIDIDKGELHTNAAKLLQSLLPGVKEVLIDEKRKATELLEQLKNELGDDLGRDTWINASRDIIAFLTLYNTKYGGSYPGPLRERAAKIEENATLLARLCRRAAEVVGGNKFSLELAFFSTDPCQTMKDALQLRYNQKCLCFHHQKPYLDIILYINLHD